MAKKQEERQHKAVEAAIEAGMLSRKTLSQVHCKTLSQVHCESCVLMLDEGGIMLV